MARGGAHPSPRPRSRAMDAQPGAAPQPRPLPAAALGRPYDTLSAAVRGPPTPAIDARTVRPCGGALALRRSQARVGAARLRPLPQAARQLRSGCGVAALPAAKPWAPR